MAVTSRDVARVAGVSQPTVSRALRDDPRLSNATKQRVREAAQLLGYVLSDAGRALSSGRTRRIGLLVTDLNNEFYHHIIAPVHHELESRGYQLLLHTESDDNGSVVDRLLANGMDGVVLATTTIDSTAPCGCATGGCRSSTSTAPAPRSTPTPRSWIPCRASRLPSAARSSSATAGWAPCSDRPTPARDRAGNSRCARPWPTTACPWKRGTCAAAPTTPPSATPR